MYYTLYVVSNSFLYTLRVCSVKKCSYASSRSSLSVDKAEELTAKVAEMARAKREQDAWGRA